VKEVSLFNNYFFPIVDVCLSCEDIARQICKAYFNVYYYTKCVFLKAGCAILKRKVCNIKKCLH